MKMYPDIRYSVQHKASAVAEVNNNQVEADRQQRSPASALAGEAVRAGGGGDLQRATSLLAILYLDTALSRGEAAQCLRSDHV